MQQWTIDVTPELDRQSSWRTVVTLSVIFTVLMLITVGLRLWFRRKNIQAEDYIIVVAALCALAFNVIQTLETRYGYGLPVPLRAKSQSITFHTLNMIARPISSVGLAGFKLALCISYLRILDRTKRPLYRWFIIFAAFVFTTGTLIVGFLYAFECWPMWKSIVPESEGTCLNFEGITYFYSAICILGDATVFLLPIPLIINLNLERSTKIGLVFIFSLGLCTTILTILRTTQVPVIVNTGDNTLLGMYFDIEMNVGVITACLPVLRPMLSVFKKKVVNVVQAKRQAGDTSDSPEAEEQYDKKHSDRFSVFKSSDKSTKSDADSDEIMLEAGPQHNQSYPHPQYRWGDMSILKTVDYSVEARSESVAGSSTKKEEWTLP